MKNFKVGNHATLNQWDSNGVYKGAYVKILERVGLGCYKVKLDKKIHGYPDEIIVSEFCIFKED